MNEIPPVLFRDVHAIVKARLPRWAVSQIGDDIVQESILRATQFHSSCSGYEYSMSAIAIRSAKDMVRKFWRNVLRTPVAELGVEETDVSVKPCIDPCEIQEELNALRKQMSDKEWSVFYQSSFLGLTDREIANKMGLSPGRIRHIKSTVRQRIRASQSA
jgi:RNA polymerase sigma factor (sigma-70 family)